MITGHMIASLPMYDRPETAAANDRLWQGIQTSLGYGPPSLTRDEDIWGQWQSPDLILSQTCGYPYRAHLHGRVTLVGTPDYGHTGCLPGYYCSVLVVRHDDLRQSPAEFATARFAYNEPLSQSGWAAPQIFAAEAGFGFSDLVQTGAHRASAKAVADGRADIASLDALSWQMMQRYDDFATGLKVLDQTQPSPALPFITAVGRDDAAIFKAIERAIEQLSDADRKTLGLKGIVRIAPQAYLAVPNPPPPDTR